MKNTIITCDTIKIIDGSLKNKNGFYSDKNQFLIDIATRCLTMRNIGENFLISTLYGKSLSYKGIDEQYHKYMKGKAIDNAIAEFLLNFSITFEDRVFELAENSNGQKVIYMLNKKVQPKTIYVKDKTSSVVSTYEVINDIDGSIEEISDKKKKNVRLLNEQDKTNILHSFNIMLGSGYNKPLAVAVEKKSKNA